jgi:hypothetical protein
MAYKDVVRDLGNHVKIGPNTKNTGTRGVPETMAQIGRTQTAPATENPSKGGLTTVGKNIEPLQDISGGRRKNVSTKNAKWGPVKS